MKKAVIIIVSLILVTAIGVLIPFIVNSGDKFVSSSVTALEAGTYVINIDTEKQDLPTKCCFSINKNQLGENYYLYKFIFNQQMLETLEPDYKVDYLNVSFEFNYGDEIISAYGTDDKSVGYSEIRAENDSLSFSGNTEYMEIEFLMYDANAEDKIDLTISCAVQGGGFNSLNRIHEIEHKVSF